MTSENQGFTDLGYARPDVDREARLGLPEVVYGPGKPAHQVVGVVSDLLAANDGPVLVTRVGTAVAADVLAALPGGVHDERARLLVWRPARPRGFRIAIVSAGTSDGPVVAEAAGVAAAVGLDVDQIADVGVAGIHRLLAVRERIDGADAVVCVAGMEGALPSVVAGLISRPVIAVPTSVGYGAAFEGVTALLAMLSSCAAGVTVVNIDSGFGGDGRPSAGCRGRARAGRPVIVWINPVGGVSGDMLLGALIGLGAPLDGVRAAVASTGLTGWDIEVGAVRRGALLATRANVLVEEQPPERRAAELLAIVARARPRAVAQVAGRAVAAMARVEARLHGVPVDEVHLHEIGGIDTVVDTVGVAAALELLGVDAVHCGPLPMGTGTVTTRHGTIPLPAPATAALVAEAGAPVTAGGDRETVTPTGIALLLAVATRFGPMPDMAVRAVGYGAGGRDDPDRANVVQALLGAVDPAPPGAVAPMVLLETTVDDVPGELLGYVLERALAAGAADAWITPVVMKKSRPGHTVHLLTTPDRAAACEILLLRETGSLGLRRHTVDRRALPRHTTTVDVDGQAVRIKHGPHGAKPEHDDLAAAAAALDLPLREVAARALREPG